MVLALREFYAACRHAGADPADGFGYAAALVILIASVPVLDSPGVARDAGPFAGRRSTEFFYLGFTLLLVASLVVELGRKQRAPLRNLAPTWLGVVYVGWLFPFVARLRWLSAEDLSRIGWPVAPPPGWLTDLTGYRYDRTDPGAVQQETRPGGRCSPPKERPRVSRHPGTLCVPALL